MKQFSKLLVLVLLLLASCKKENEMPTPPPQPNNPDTPLVDQVLTTFDGKVSILANGDHLIGYLMKRFSNQEFQLLENVDAILLDETAITNITNNPEHLTIY